METISSAPLASSVVYTSTLAGSWDPVLDALIRQYFDINKKIYSVVTGTSPATDTLPCTQMVIPIPLNTQSHINTLLEQANIHLEPDGLLAGFTDVAEGYKKKLLSKKPYFLFYASYVLKFLVHRVFPKLTRGTHRLYKRLHTKNVYWYTYPEILGILYRNGFHIIESRKENDVLFFVARKRALPDFQSQPTYWPVVKMKRVGKQGKIISVYKFRTMHPYAEYLQEYIKNKNGLDAGGKFKNDIRVSTWGKIMRKYWIDELPMIVNIMKGDLKLIGVRPISKHYFSMYSDELKALRVKHKPGLIPPFYADMPKTLLEIMESEKKYLQQYEKNPFLTDCSYFFKILFNIFIKKARSK